MQEISLSFGSSWGTFMGSVRHTFGKKVFLTTSWGCGPIFEMFFWTFWCHRLAFEGGVQEISLFFGSSLCTFGSLRLTSTVVGVGVNIEDFRGVPWKEPG